MARRVSMHTLGIVLTAEQIKVGMSSLLKYPDRLARHVDGEVELNRIRIHRAAFLLRMNASQLESFGDSVLSSVCAHLLLSFSANKSCPTFIWLVS